MYSMHLTVYILQCSLYSNKLYIVHQNCINICFFIGFHYLMHIIHGIIFKKGKNILLCFSTLPTTDITVYITLHILGIVLLMLIGKEHW